MPKFIHLVAEFIKPDSLKSKNRYLAMVAVLLITLLFLDLLLIHPKKESLKNLTQKYSTGSSGALPPPSERQPYSYYADQIANRSLFVEAIVQREVDSTQVPDTSLLKNVTLVGILPGDNPQAILEDNQTKQTYYLFEHQSMNGLTVEDIQDNRVILEYNGQKQVLTL